MEAAATLRQGAGPVDAIDPESWIGEVRDARLDVRWRASARGGYCRLERVTADGVIVKLESIGRCRRGLLVTAHAFDGISHGVALRDRTARNA
jgi:hypothetical protein